MNDGAGMTLDYPAWCLANWFIIVSVEGHREDVRASERVTGGENLVGQWFQKMGGGGSFLFLREKDGLIGTTVAV